MKSIAIVSLGYAWLPCEPGPSRFYDIAKIFAEHGYSVDLIGSSFQHFNKAPRDRDLIEKQGYPFKVTFIQTPPYKKNIDIRRVWSNMAAGKNVIKYFSNTQHRYDAVYCSLPANNIAAKVSGYCKKKKIPFIVDIEDLWPEAMEMVVKIPVLKNIIFYPFKSDAELVYRNADAVVGTSDEYTERAFKNRSRNIPKKTVYVGCDIHAFDAGIASYSSSIRKPGDEFWITYAGSIGTSYDIRTLILAGNLLKEGGYSNIKIKILGVGPLKEEMERLAATLKLDHIDFLGYVPYLQMAAYLSKSDVLVNSFVKKAPQSIVNKIGDYLAAGKPMINTLESEEFIRLVREQEFGINVEPENPQALFQSVVLLYQNRKISESMSSKARQLAERKFDRKISYLEIVKLVEQLTEG